MSRISTNSSLYLTDDTRWRHSYYGTLIGTRMRSIYIAPFPMTLSDSYPDFKITELLQMPSTYCVRKGRAICLRYLSFLLMFVWKQTVIPTWRDAK